MSLHPEGNGCPNRINVTVMMDDADRFVCGCENDPTLGARYVHLRPSDALVIYGLAEGAASNIDDEWAAQAADRFGCASVLMIEGNCDFAVIRKELEDDKD